MGENTEVWKKRGVGEISQKLVKNIQHFLGENLQYDLSFDEINLSVIVVDSTVFLVILGNSSFPNKVKAFLMLVFSLSKNTVSGLPIYMWMLCSQNIQQ